MATHFLPYNKSPTCKDFDAVRDTKENQRCFTRFRNNEVLLAKTEQQKRTQCKERATRVKRKMERQMERRMERRTANNFMVRGAPVSCSKGREACLLVPN